MSKTNRGTSPMPFDRYDILRGGLNDGEVAVISQLPPYGALAPYHPPTHHLRNALLLGLGAGIGFAYHYRAPLKKLGQKSINYVSDKFHNLYKPTNETIPLSTNPHNW